MTMRTARSWLVVTVIVFSGHSILAQDRLVTGKHITPRGQHVAVGSFPCNMLPVHDGRFVVVTNSGFRQALSVISTATGQLVSRIDITGARNGVKEGLYYGLAAEKPTAEGQVIWVSRGSEERVHAYRVDANGQLTDLDRSLSVPRPGGPTAPRDVIAGVAVNSTGTLLYAAGNMTSRRTGFQGTLTILNTSDGRTVATARVGGFPLAVAALTAGPHADRKVYVSSERDAVVHALDARTGSLIREIRTGANPAAFLLDRSQGRLFVANSGSDTVSIIDTNQDKVQRTILLRPNEFRGLPGSTPLGMALSPDERRLFVALADMNAVAVVDLMKFRVAGYIPVGWYPTAVAVSPDGQNLLVANARGTKALNPNKQPAGPDGAWGQYVGNIIEGDVSFLRVPTEAELVGETLQVMVNNRVAEARQKGFRNPGIKHVFYIIKENRTYDQVLGDLPQGNGDPSLCLFPREVTPNQHALAERFGLFDNFYCCADVSADGWNWSTAGMVNEYTQRNALYGYSGRGRAYDYEGMNNNSPVDLLGLPDVAKSPSDYIWDLCLRRGVSIRNYGFFVNEIGQDEKDAVGRSLASPNAPVRRSLQPYTCTDFLQYDMRYADSDAWVIYNCPAPQQMQTFGSKNYRSRFEAWKAEFDEYVRKGNLPRFIMIRLPRDHTQGTSPGHSSPRAMVADNDYAVGQVVEAISHSPYWKKSAIFIVEDDAQNGHDHVDAHRSIAFVISPFCKRGAVHSEFYNTDSVLRTMGLLLGLPPLCQYDAVATPIDCFTRKPENIEPFKAILPAREIIAEVNQRTAYMSHISTRLNFAEADAVPDAILNHILWHALKGTDVPEPDSPSAVRVRREDVERYMEAARP